MSLPNDSLKELRDRIRWLEDELKAVPMRISAYQALPFAIFRYEPGDEWGLRNELQLLAVRMGEANKQVQFISFATLLWEAIEACEGIEAVIRLEQRAGFEATQSQIATYLTDPVWAPLTDRLAERLHALDPQRDIVFLTRAAAMAPAIYHISTLLDGIVNHNIQVPTILFYPGTTDGMNNLRFMNLPFREATGNYRVKIYG